MAQELAASRLLACLGWQISAPPVQFESFSDFEWEAVMRLSNRHNVLPYLYHKLKINPNAAHIPDWVLRTFRQTYHQGSLQTEHHFSEFSVVLEALAETGIPVIVLKGAHLAEIIYEHRSLRLMTDFDLLVKRQDLQTVTEKLFSLGYSFSRPFNLEDELDSHHHLPPLVKTGALPIEIHWALLNPGSPFQVDTVGLWARANSDNIAGVHALVLSPEDLLIYLCLHAAYSHHFHFGIKPFLDITEVLRRFEPNINWQIVVERVKKWGSPRPVFLALYLSRELLPAPIPEGILAELYPEEFDTEIVGWARSAILGGSESPILSQEIYNFGEVESPFNILAIVLRRILLPPRQLAALYPHLAGFPRIFLGYPKRLWDLAHRYGHTTLRVLSKDQNILDQASREAYLAQWLDS